MPEQDNNPPTGIPPEFLKKLQKGLNIPEDINQYPKTPDECIKSSISPEEAFKLEQRKDELNEFIVPVVRLVEIKEDNLGAMAALNVIMKLVNERWKELDKGAIQYDYVKDVLIPTLNEYGACLCTKHSGQTVPMVDIT